MKVCEVCERTSDDFKWMYTLEVSGNEHVYCSKHYQLVKNKGRTQSVNDMKKDRTCDVCGVHSKDSVIMTTSKFGEKMDLCKKHYERMISKGSTDARPVENKITHKDGYVEIELYDIKGVLVGVTLVDDELIELVKHIKWHRVKGGKRFYARGKYNGVQVNMHQYIAKHLYGEPPTGHTVDHINRNGLDNREANLRYASPSDQVVNRELPKNKSGHTGVDFAKHTNMWRARMQYKGVSREEFFGTMEDAINKREEWKIIRDKGEWLNDN